MNRPTRYLTLRLLAAWLLRLRLTCGSGLNLGIALGAGLGLGCAMYPPPIQAEAARPAAPAPTAPLSPADQQRADRLAHALRCLVCQNQSLADSNAPLAHDMRDLIHAQLADGRSDAQIMRFFEDRYGDFVRYDPPFKPITWLLWLGPFALLAAGFLVLLRTLRRRTGTRAPLTADERARAARFLDTGS